MHLIDLHTHILPGVDDGAANLTEALSMLRNAAASDVVAVVATPHCNVPGAWENFRGPERKERFRAFREAARSAGIPVEILSGAEVHLTDQVCRLFREGKIATLNHTRYLLAEFDFDQSAQLCFKQLEALQELGVVPVVAHPERYHCVCREPEVAAAWVEMGCHLQLTAGSILGKFGRREKNVSDWLMDMDLVACVASDAHGGRRRTNFLMDVFDHIALYHSRAYAQALLWERPHAILRNEEL